MIVQVVDKGQYILGYLIEDKFFSHSFISLVLRGSLAYTRTEFGCKINRGILVCNNYYETSDYLTCLQGLSLDLSYNDISFIERRPSSIEFQDLSAFWKVSDLINHYLYTVVDNKLNILGYFMTDKDIYTSLDCFISMLEIKDKGRGTGSLVIDKLSRLVTLHGLSCINAVDFWVKNGAVFSRGYCFNIDRKM